jgi:DNA-binding MarR family transcriptional regulator
MKTTREAPPNPDKVVHERARLRILVYLASSEEPETGFTLLQSELEMTAGNLSVQLATLESSGYVKVKKSFVGRKPYTGISLTPEGKNALENYLGEMQTMIAALSRTKD